MDDPSNSKRRRGLGVVTANACTECRKKRAKCDGQQPCGRCSTQKGVECFYEVPIRQSKEKMRAEMENLQKRQRDSDRVLAALVSPETSEQVLEQIRSGEAIEEISERLHKSGFKASGEADVTTHTEHDDAAEDPRHSRGMSTSSLPMSGFSDTQPYEQMWSAWEAPDRSPPEDMMSWKPEPPTLPSLEQSGGGNWYTPAGTVLNSNVVQRLGKEVLLGSDLATGDSGHRPQSWTRMTSDPSHVEHLMALYFCWEYPVFAPFSKEHFLAHYKAGSQRYCSSLLVNAILAVGCRFSAYDKARTNPHDSNTAGDHFYDEFTRLLYQERDYHKLTTIQALVLVSLREGSCGRTTEGLYFSGQAIRLAVEMGLHIDTDAGKGDSIEADSEHTVRSATFWGAFSLDQAWSMTVGKLPHLSKHLRLVTKPAIFEQVEASSWMPYIDDESPPEKSSIQASNIRSIFKTFCELSEIMHRSMYILYTPGSNVNSRALIDTYTEYLRWYDSIPEALRLGQNSTPAVLFAHMEYHSAILLLFRPFLKLDINGSGVSPRDVCTQAADAIAALVNSYSQLYTLDRTPSFVPYFVLSSSTIHLANLATSDDDGGGGGGGGGRGRERGEEGEGNSKEKEKETVVQAIEDLKKMAPAHGFATRALDILRFLALQWNVDIPFDDSTAGFEERCHSRSESANFFCPIGSAGKAGGDEGGGGRGDGGEGMGMLLRSETAGNPLFWTFPLQGRPFVVTAPRGELEKAGFRVR